MATPGTAGKTGKPEAKLSAPPASKEAQAAAIEKIGALHDRLKTLTVSVDMRNKDLATIIKKTKSPRKEHLEYLVQLRDQALENIKKELQAAEQHPENAQQHLLNCAHIANAFSAQVDSALLIYVAHGKTAKFSQSLIKYGAFLQEAIATALGRQFSVEDYITATNQQLHDAVKTVVDKVNMEEVTAEEKDSTGVESPNPRVWQANLKEVNKPEEKDKEYLAVWATGISPTLLKQIRTGTIASPTLAAQKRYEAGDKYMQMTQDHFAASRSKNPVTTPRLPPQQATHLIEVGETLDRMREFNEKFKNLRVGAGLFTKGIDFAKIAEMEGMPKDEMLQKHEAALVALQRPLELAANALEAGDGVAFNKHYAEFIQAAEDFRQYLYKANLKFIARLRIPHIFSDELTEFMVLLKEDLEVCIGVKSQGKINLAYLAQEKEKAKKIMYTAIKEMIKTVKAENKTILRETLPHGLATQEILKMDRAGSPADAEAEITLWAVGRAHGLINLRLKGNRLVDGDSIMERTHKDVLARERDFRQPGQEITTFLSIRSADLTGDAKAVPHGEQKKAALQKSDIFAALDAICKALYGDFEFTIKEDRDRGTIVFTGTKGIVTSDKSHVYPQDWTERFIKVIGGTLDFTNKTVTEGTTRQTPQVTIDPRKFIQILCLDPLTFEKLQILAGKEGHPVAYENDQVHLSRAILDVVKSESIKVKPAVDKVFGTLDKLKRQLDALSKDQLDALFPAPRADAKATQGQGVTTAKWWTGSPARAGEDAARAATERSPATEHPQQQPGRPPTQTGPK